MWMRATLAVALLIAVAGRGPALAQAEFDDDAPGLEEPDLDEPGPGEDEPELAPEEPEVAPEEPEMAPEEPQDDGGQGHRYDFDGEDDDTLPTEPTMGAGGEPEAPAETAPPVGGSPPAAEPGGGAATGEPAGL